MGEFNEDSTTDEVIAGIDLTGKCAVVTGASSGLGLETARALAGAGARVLLTARDAGKLARAQAELAELLPGVAFDSVLFDLSDLDSVRAGADAIRAACPRIDLLINNAGVMACPLAHTAQGFEMQFGTNHLGHFLLTSRLLPSLLAGAPCRVVNLSSAAHRFGGVNLDDPNYRQRDYNKWQAYGESKTANALFSVGLEQRYGAQGVHALAVHPGVIMTELGRHMEPADFDLITGGAGVESLRPKTIAAGAATSVWAATAPALEGVGGVYLADCQQAPLGAEGVAPYAVDPTIADQLWTLSEELVGETFGAN